MTLELIPDNSPLLEHPGTELVWERSNQEHPPPKTEENAFIEGLANTIRKLVRDLKPGAVEAGNQWIDENFSHVKAKAINNIYEFAETVNQQLKEAEKASLDLGKTDAFKELRHKVNQ